MLETLLSIVVVWIIIAVVLWGVAQLAFDATIQRIIRVIAIVGGVIWTLFRLFPGVIS
jgi:hypothetical protein